MLYTQHILFLVYRHASVFLVDYIEHFFSVWVSFESAWINCLFFYTYIYLPLITTLYCQSLKEWTLFISHHEHWCRMFFFNYSNAVANTFFKNDGFIVTLIVRCAMQCLLWFYIFFKWLSCEDTLELQWIFLDEVTVEAMPFMIVVKDE